MLSLRFILGAGERCYEEEHRFPRQVHAVAYPERFKAHKGCRMRGGR